VVGVTDSLNVGRDAALIFLFLNLVASLFKSKIRLEAENAALRHQLIVLQRKVRGRCNIGVIKCRCGRRRRAATSCFCSGLPTGINSLRWESIS
jgi:hypothetical protein